MMFIPGILISVLTFPGVIVHEAAHLLFCRWRRVAVLQTCFFNLGEPAGFVVHETTPDFTTIFLVSTGPFFVNSALCVLLCLPAVVPIMMFDRGDWLSYFVAWLGVSIGMHAIPSTQDATNVWQAAKDAARRWHPLAIASFPVVVLIYGANLLRFFWFDYAYGVAIGLVLPGILLNLAA